jgi:hypothetical protein
MMAKEFKLDNEKVIKAIKQQLSGAKNRFMSDDELISKIKSIILEATGNNLYLISNVNILNELTMDFYGQYSKGELWS